MMYHQQHVTTQKHWTAVSGNIRDTQLQIAIIIMQIINVKFCESNPRNAHCCLCVLSTVSKGVKCGCCQQDIHLVCIAFQMDLIKDETNLHKCKGLSEEGSSWSPGGSVWSDRRLSFLHTTFLNDTRLSDLSEREANVIQRTENWFQHDSRSIAYDFSFDLKENPFKNSWNDNCFFLVCFPLIKSTRRINRQII